MLLIIVTYVYFLLAFIHMYIFYLFLYLIPDACYFVHTLACFAIASARDLHSVHFHENLVDLKSHISYISESCLHGKYCNSQSFFCAFCALNLYIRLHLSRLQKRIMIGQKKSNTHACYFIEPSLPSHRNLSRAIVPLETFANVLCIF